MIHGDFSSFVLGKRTILVGPALSTAGSGLRDFVESHDIVARMNRALPVPGHMRMDVGERCDILYHCEVQREDCGGPLNARAMREAGLKWLASPHNRSVEGFYGCGKSMHGRYTRPFVRFAERHGFNCHIPDAKWYAGLCRKVNHPNTGTAAIADLLNHGAASVATIGITMMRGGYEKSYRDMDEAQALDHVARYTGHDIERQRQFLLNTLRTDARFQPDDALRMVLEAEG